MNAAEPELTTLIVSYNTKALLAPCLEALARAQVRRGAGPVIVVDNASKDGSADELQVRFPQVQLIRSPWNMGFGRANNLALKQVDTPFLLLLNTDAFVAPESLERALGHMAQQPDCGVLGVRLVGRDRRVQPSCRHFPTPWNTFLVRTGLAGRFPGTRLVDDPGWDPQTSSDCDWVPGCFYLVRREVWTEVGLFDPRYFLYFEEVDHCQAVRRAGWRVRYCAETEVIHLGGESAGNLGSLTESGRQVAGLQLESAMLYFRKHHGLSGLCAHLALEALADVMTAANALLRLRGFAQAWRPLQGLGLRLRLAAATGLGSRATR